MKLPWVSRSLLEAAEGRYATLHTDYMKLLKTQCDAVAEKQQNARHKKPRTTPIDDEALREAFDKRREA